MPVTLRNTVYGIHRGDPAPVAQAKPVPASEPDPTPDWYDPGSADKPNRNSPAPKEAAKSKAKRQKRGAVKTQKVK